MNVVSNRGAVGVLMDCSAPSLSAGYLASMWNVPIVAIGATTPSLSDKNMYNTVTRVFAPYSIVGQGMMAILRMYNWTTVGLLNEDISDPRFPYLPFMQVSCRLIYTCICLVVQ